MDGGGIASNAVSCARRRLRISIYSGGHFTTLNIIEPIDRKNQIDEKFVFSISNLHFFVRDLNKYLMDILCHEESLLLWFYYPFDHVVE